MVCKISPSQEFRLGHRRTKTNRVNRLHMLTTEAQTLDQALEIIEHQQAHDRASKTAKERPLTVRQENARAKMASDHKSITLAGGYVVKGPKAKMLEKTHAARRTRGPHPFRDLSLEEQRDKAIALFQGGGFGTGARAGRALAKLFKVSNETMSEWLGIRIWTSGEFNELVAKGEI